MLLNACYWGKKYLKIQRYPYCTFQWLYNLFLVFLSLHHCTSYPLAFDEITSLKKSLEKQALGKCFIWDPKDEFVPKAFMLYSLLILDLSGDTTKSLQMLIFFLQASGYFAREMFFCALSALWGWSVHQKSSVLHYPHFHHVTLKYKNTYLFCLFS